MGFDGFCGINAGVEAPRNSLEMDGPFTEAASFPSTMTLEEQTLNIPVKSSSSIFLNIFFYFPFFEKDSCFCKAPNHDVGNWIPEINDIFT